MRRYTSLYSLLVGVLALSLAVTGCDFSRDLEQVNEDPNSPTQADPNALLANGQRLLAFSTYGAGPSMVGGNLFAQYTTQNFYPQESRYRSVTYDWADMYNALNDLEAAKRLVREDPSRVQNADNFVAAALIHQTWAFHILTDVYGDVPYFEALGGTANRSPVYSAQQEIYPALVDSLDSALGLIANGAPGPSGDLVNDGDMSQWARFANALKMRIGMRMVDANRTEAEAAITSANGNALQSNADNIYFQFGTSAEHRNTIYENRYVQGRDDYDVSGRFVDAMKQYATDDPRMAAYFEPSCESGTDFQGFPFGLQQSNAQSLFASAESCVYSRPNDFFLEGPSGSGDAYAPMLYYHEVLLIKAEAAARGIVSGDAKSLLEEAIRASMRFYDVDAQSSQADDYIQAVMNDYDTNGFEQVIGEQRWIALYFTDIQGWSTWRRLDFTGHLQPPAGGTVGNLQNPNGTVGVPLRADYPEEEYSLNEENVRAAAQSQFDQQQYETPGSTIWWDVDGPPAEIFE